jgi:hypothetical protein
MGMKARCSSGDTIAAVTPDEIDPIPQAERPAMSTVTVYVGLDLHKR